MVSIIIPHYNRSVLLKDTIASVLKQTSKDWELLIIDDGSDLREFEAIQAFANDRRIFVIKRKSHLKGPSVCRNEGVNASKGEYLIFLDSDDALAPWCIQQRMQVMDANKDLDMGIFLMQEFDVMPGDRSKIFNYNSTNENSIHYFLEGNNPWAVTCPIWRKDFFIKTEGFDESFFYMEDPELHIRALLQPGIFCKTFYDCPPDCYYRVNFHDLSKKNFYENSIRYRIQFYKKTEQLLSGRPELSGQYKKSFERGVINFFSNFLLSRVKKFPQLQKEFIALANQSNLLSRITKLKLKIVSAIYENDNPVFIKLHVKGLVARILMALG